MKTSKMGRREFLQNVAYGSAALSASGLSPTRLMAQTMSGSSSPTGKRLLVLNLAGGFDPVYVLQPDIGELADARRPLFQNPNSLLPFNNQLGLTPSFPLLGELFQRGEAVVIHRVGLLNATREHLSSERTNARGTADRLAPPERGGWVQRVADANPDSIRRLTDVVDFANGNPTVSGGRFTAATVNPALQTFARGSLPEVRALGEAGVFAENAISVRTPLALKNTQGSLTANELSESLATASRNEAAARSMMGLDEYPDTALGRTISSVETVFAQLNTQIAYVRTGGFDTHFTQADRIPQLFGNVNASLTAFRNNLIKRGLWDDTIILTTTDFGRIFRMNASRGTDHGRGADAFVIGPSVAGRRIIGEEYTAADFRGKRFLDMRINSQNILREAVGALGYDPDKSFVTPRGQEQELRIFS